MIKAAVIGNGAGGKSTLCRKLAEAHQLPLSTVDEIQWKPNWVPAPQAEVAAALLNIINKDRWLIDGWGPWETIEERFVKADTIILVDHPLYIHLWWAAKRQIKALFNKESVEQPEGCNMAAVTGRMFRIIWKIHFEIRPKLLILVERFKADKKKRVFHLRSPGDLESFISEQCQ